MIFICVNGIADPKEFSVCGFCQTTLGKNYIRDLESGAVYHHHHCRQFHIDVTMAALGGGNGPKKRLRHLSA